jgi:signal transduction histidine kinase
LNELINDILYLDKLESGTIKLNIQKNNIIDTYHKALNLFITSFNKKIHHSEINLLNENEYFYDEARIIQVFQNILGNAYKFTEDGGMIQVKFQEKDNLLKIGIFNTGKKFL